MVYIILPVFKRVSLTVSFVESVRNSTDLNVHFIIVDDESPGYSNYITFLNSHDVTVLKTKGDVWWCETVYIGIKYLFDNIQAHELANDFIVLANNDVEVNNGTFKIFDILDDNCILHPLTKLKRNGDIISSGCKVKSWLPFITDHSIDKKSKLTSVDMLTARFLCMKGSVLLKNGNVSTCLLQYHGDSEFTLRATKKGIKNCIVNDIEVHLDDNDNSAINQKSIFGYFKSSLNEKKSNSIKQKYLFLRCNFGPFKSQLIVLSMFFNGFVKTFLRKIF
ncbi:glycosyltransferase family 2 protein [Pseudoalteromonas sp. PS5]|uniref:glycosyltransferase family 2 protein n=1 Tax=Pseudoalteromonas sp. PS5 TaxID=1437473 RepID=UPI000FFE4B82|nr:glycosyltransferase family 2 protein [Pseudoalteromonas sp. PS5]RXF01986.1 glycosyltransferase family 2 protein [Pseudoalteromonas sp. PS5]